MTRSHTLSVAAVMTTSRTLGGHHMPLGLLWHPHRPLEVTAVMGAVDPQEWVWGRDLLIAGLEGPTGDGQVHIRPLEGPTGLRLEVRVTGWCRTIQTWTMPYGPVARWAWGTLAVVPQGHEDLALPATPHQLLRGVAW